MSDSLALYSTILTQVRTANPQEDLRRQKVFAWLVLGLLLEQTINLPYLANAIVSCAKAASRERRVQRFLTNVQVQVRAYYDTLIRSALVEWTGQTLYLVIDTTSLAGRLVIVDGAELTGRTLYMAAVNLAFALTSRPVEASPLPGRLQALGFTLTYRQHTTRHGRVSVLVADKTE